MSYPSYLDITRGIARGLSSDDKFGRNSAVGTTFVPVCTGGFYQTPQASGATTLRVAAGSANDIYGGSGAWSVVVVGIGPDGSMVSDTLRCNGDAAGTPGTVEFIRVFRCYISESGTYATQSISSQAGSITIESADGVDTWAVIRDTDLGRGQSQIAAITVPRGYRMFLASCDFSVETTKVATIVLFKRDNILDASAPYSAMRVQEEYVGVIGELSHVHEPPIGPFNEMTDVGFLAKVSGQTGDISITFAYILEAI